MHSPAHWPQPRRTPRIAAVPGIAAALGIGAVPGIAAAPALAAALLLAALLAGCANPGSPRPPSLRLPGPATGLTAQRVGAEVRLRWTTPAETTDGDAIRFPIAAVVVCRQQAQAAACQPVQRMTVTPGAAEVTDALPPALLAGGPDVLLTYRVELRNGSGRFAGPAVAYAASGPAPAPVAGFAVEATREGALVRWQAAAAQGGEPQSRMEVRRVGPPLPDKADSSGGTTGSTRAKANPSGRRGVQPTGERKAGETKGGDGKPRETVLLADVPAQAKDPGGMVDREVRQARLQGVTWTYQAQWVRTETLGGHTLEVRGMESAPVLFRWEDVFAPGAPAGLASVPSVAPPAIDLSWEPVFEAGVTGYNVYRLAAGAGSGSFLRLNAEPLPGSSFRDLAVKPGASYRYRVTAVGAHGMESAPSPEIEETVR